MHTTKMVFKVSFLFKLFTTQVTSASWTILRWYLKCLFCSKSLPQKLQVRYVQHEDDIQSVFSVQNCYHTSGKSASVMQSSKMIFQMYFLFKIFYTTKRNVFSKLQTRLTTWIQKRWWWFIKPGCVYPLKDLFKSID